MEEVEPEGGESYSAALGEHAGNPPHPRQSGVSLVLPDGRAHKVATDEVRIKAQFEEWLKESALSEIARLMKLGRMDEAEDLRSSYLTDCAAKAFTWDGKNSRAARKDWGGNTYLLYLMLRRCDPKITLDYVDDLMEDHPRLCGDAMRLAQGNWRSSLARKQRKERARAATNGTTTEDGDGEPTTASETPTMDR